VGRFSRVRSQRGHLAHVLRALLPTNPRHVGVVLPVPSPCEQATLPQYHAHTRQQLRGVSARTDGPLLLQSSLYAIDSLRSSAPERSGRCGLQANASFLCGLPCWDDAGPWSAATGITSTALRTVHSVHSFRNPSTISWSVAPFVCEVWFITLTHCNWHAHVPTADGSLCNWWLHARKADSEGPAQGVRLFGGLCRVVSLARTE
jgi:hypothetical protein